MLIATCCKNTIFSSFCSWSYENAKVTAVSGKRSFGAMIPSLEFALFKIVVKMYWGGQERGAKVRFYSHL